MRGAARGPAGTVSARWPLDGDGVDTGSPADPQGPAGQLADRASLAPTAPRFEVNEPKLERGWLHVELHERCGRTQDMSMAWM